MTVEEALHTLTTAGLLCRATEKEPLHILGGLELRATGITKGGVPVGIFKKSFGIVQQGETFEVRIWCETEEAELGLPDLETAVARVLALYRGQGYLHPNVNP